MKIRCIIVDDEPLAQRVLEKYITSLSSLELMAKCNDALEAMSYLHEHHVDVMFLDIKMPRLSGLDLLKTLKNPPFVILTTAFSEYALEGYEYSVIDYLLKPFSSERFLKAINKIIDQKMAKEEHAVPQSHQEITHDFIFFKSDKINHKISFAEIKYIEGYGNYVKVFLRDKMLLISETMNNIQKNLPGNIFLRTHKSYIVSIKKITQIEGNMIRIGDARIPIGKHYKMNVLEILAKYNLK